MGLNLKKGDLVVEKRKTSPVMEVTGATVVAGSYKVKEGYFTCFWQDTIGRHHKEFQANELELLKTENKSKLD